MNNIRDLENVASEIITDVLTLDCNIQFLKTRKKLFNFIKKTIVKYLQRYLWGHCTLEGTILIFKPSD